MVGLVQRDPGSILPFLISEISVSLSSLESAAASMGPLWNQALAENLGHSLDQRAGIFEVNDRTKISTWKTFVKEAREK